MAAGQTENQAPEGVATTADLGKAAAPGGEGDKATSFVSKDGTKVTAPARMTDALKSAGFTSGK